MSVPLLCHVVVSKGSAQRECNVVLVYVVTHGAVLGRFIASSVEKL